MLFVTDLPPRTEDKEEDDWVMALGSEENNDEITFSTEDDQWMLKHCS